MAMSTGASLALATISALFLFSGMQMYLTWFTATHLRTLFAGYLGSYLFLFLLTAVGNIETCFFGRSFQIKVFPEVLLCLLVSAFSSGLVHRVAATSCVLFSLIQLHYINKYSQKVHTVPVTVPTVQPGKKKK